MGAFLTDLQELKDGLVIFRRADVQHRKWYCRIRLPHTKRYKIVSLKTSDVDAARDRAFDQEADVRFRLKHEVPVFNRSFSQVAQDFSDFQKQRSAAGEITFHRWRVMDSHIRTQLNRYVGTVQINLIGQDRWKGYPVWRQANGKGRSGGRVSDGTIRDEMATFRSVMAYAASKRYITESQLFKGKLPLSQTRREEFTPPEYRKLHTFARSWITQARNEMYTWYRTVAYNFVLIMCNTGMRPSEARNLRWRDVISRTHRDGQSFVILNVRGKSKHRSLVAAHSVANYLERIRKLSKAKKHDDFVFTNFKGERSKTLYYDLIETLLIDSELLMSSSGKRRSIYCFRHTYATFRLTEGVDVYFLAKQMGTSVQMIEQHYGHITPVKNAERILQGLPGWEPAGAANESETAISAEEAAPVRRRPGRPRRPERPKSQP